MFPASKNGAVDDTLRPIFSLKPFKAGVFTGFSLTADFSATFLCVVGVLACALRQLRTVTKVTATDINSNSSSNGGVR